MSENEIQFSCADGYTLNGTRFDHVNANGRAVVIASALGVPRKFYTPLARFLADQGFCVLTFDYRGIGDSRKGPVRGSAMRMEDWGRLDIDAALGWALRQFKSAKFFLLGHSAGAQLAGLAANSQRLDAMVFASVSSAHPGHWPMPARLSLLALMHVMVPLLSIGRDFHPRIGALSSMPVPAGVTAQWARWGRTPGYLFDPAHALDRSGYARLRKPLLAFHFDDDDYGPLPAHEAILAAYPNCTIARRRIKAADLGGKIGHFGFFRERMRDTLWKQTADWMLNT